MKNIAIIPARSGSKGLPDKNIRLLNGKPLIAYTIEAAQKSNQFDTVMVSTDSEKYAELAREYGAEVPFLRSKQTSTDTASSWDVVQEVLDGYRSMGCVYDNFCLLQPTSPLRDAQDIIDAFAFYRSKQATSVISVCEMEHSPRWSNVLDDSRSMANFIRTKDMVGRQQMDTYYRINGALYLVQVSHFEANHEIYDSGSYAFLMDKKKSVDIDDKMDFFYAETLLANANQ